MGMRTACSAFGVFVSWKLKDMAATWSACHWGGVKVASAIIEALNEKGVHGVNHAMQEMVGLGIALYGFAFHLRHLNSPPLPVLVLLPLGPALIVEKLLKWVTLAGNAGLVDGGVTAGAASAAAAAAK